MEAVVQGILQKAMKEAIRAAFPNADDPIPTARDLGTDILEDIKQRYVEQLINNQSSNEATQAAKAELNIPLFRSARKTIMDARSTFSPFHLWESLLTL